MNIWAEAKRERIDAELAEHRGAVWSEPIGKNGHIILRFHGRHWLAVNRERLKAQNLTRLWREEFPNAFEPAVLRGAA